MQFCVILQLNCFNCSFSVLSEKLNTETIDYPRQNTHNITQVIVHRQSFVTQDLNEKSLSIETMQIIVLR